MQVHQLVSFAASGPARGRPVRRNRPWPLRAAVALGVLAAAFVRPLAAQGAAPAFAPARPEPVLGRQDFAILRPHDIRRGEIVFKGELRRDPRGALLLQLNSSFGEYAYRLEPEPAEGPAAKALAGLPEAEKSELNGFVESVAEEGKQVRVRLELPAGEAAAVMRLASAQPRKGRPSPTYSNISYGPHWRQVIDFYQAMTDTPTPLVVHIHGGGWSALDKSTVRDVDRLRAAGISVAAINYRLIQDAQAAGVQPPLQWPLEDAARAIQFLRAHARELNLDRSRIAATGGSAGACSALWLALHDDMAEPGSADPVKRESTRVWAAAVMGAQTSLDPEQMRAWIPNIAYGGHAFGFRKPGGDRSREFPEFLANRDRLLPWIRRYSPYEHAGPGDPPVYLDYAMQDKPPVVGEEQKDPTHSAVFGIQLAGKLRAAGVEVHVVYPGKPSAEYAGVTDFLLRKLLEGRTGRTP